MASSKALTLIHPEIQISRFPTQKSGVVAEALQWDLIISKDNVTETTIATWSFEWRNKEIIEWKGQIAAVYYDGVDGQEMKTKVVALTASENRATLSFRATGLSFDRYRGIDFKFLLEPSTIADKAKNDLEVMECSFAPSDVTDAILVLEGKQMHVNKGFLSVHSPYFRALFSDNFKEGSMPEIPINDVSYEEFARLLSVILPESIAPTEDNALDLLKLADQFDLRAVSRLCEQLLIRNQNLSLCAKLAYAEQFRLTHLKSHCWSEIKTTETLKQIGKSPEYSSLSDKCKAALLEIAMHLI